jgi:hypothetical protein
MGQQRLLHPAAAALLACAVVTVLFTMGFLAQHFGAKEPVAAAPAQTAPATPPPPGVGEPARDGELEFVASRVNCTRSTVGIEHLTRTAKGKYCVIDLSVRNITAEGSKVFLGHLQKAIDADGSSHRYDEMASLYADPDTKTLVHRLKAGDRIKVKLVFDIPQAAVLSTLELHDAPLSGGTVIAIG